MSYKDLEPFCLELLDSLIDKPLSFAAFDDQKLVAIKLNNTHTFEEFPEMYSEVIKSSPYNLKCNHIYGLYMDVVKNTGKFLPNNCKKIGVLEATGIHEKYMGCGLIHYLYALSVKKFADENCDNFASYCVAAATYESGKKIGMKQFIGLPYDAVKVNGKFPLFDMYDGATAFRAMLGNVKDSLKVVSPLL
uniref:N-acetyltransferase domain-containing protein n=1 Tax=Panagrolaimus davidi TaxID=227884 RepID=A0A914R2F4_9BILA